MRAHRDCFHRIQCISVDVSWADCFYKMTVGFSGAFACCCWLFGFGFFFPMFKVKWSTFQFVFEQSHISEMSPNAEFCWAANSSTGTVCTLGGVNFKLWAQSQLDISELHANICMEGKHADEFKQVVITWIGRVRNWSDRALDSSSVAQSTNAVHVLKG